MAYRLQFRRDTENEWERVNPSLADAEIGFIKQSGSSLYKIGEPWTQEEIDTIIENGGITDTTPEKNWIPYAGNEAYFSPGNPKKWKNLVTFGFNGKISQSLVSGVDGDDATSVLNKKVVIDEIARIWKALGVNSDDDETFEQKVNAALKEHSDTLKVLNEFAEEYGPIVDKLGEDVEKHDKDIYGFDTITTETDEETRDEVEVTVHTPGLIEKLDKAVERLDAATSSFQSSQILTDKEFSDMEKNSMLQEGVLYLTYIDEEAEGE